MQQPSLKTALLATLIVPAQLCSSSSAHQIPLTGLTGSSSNDDVSPMYRVLDAHWKALNRSVGGRLFANLPVGVACHDNFNGEPRQPSIGACMEAVINRNNMTFLSAHPAGHAQGNWDICQSTRKGCPLSLRSTFSGSSIKCMQGNLPNYYVDVRQIGDIQNVLNFAIEHGISIVVKNSGHDYQGHSAGPESISLWVHNYKAVISLDQSFVPDGCDESVGDVVTFGTGHSFDEIYTFAHRHNVTVVGASSGTVAAAGGWIAGGGYSTLSPVYGLGVDNVEQIRVVLPNGTYTVANSCTNRDLFFALRGGGGGTFGVVTEMSMRALPRIAALQWAYVAFRNLSIAGQRRLLDVLARNAEIWFDAGWGGRATPAGPRPDGIYSVQLMNPRISAREAEVSLRPLLDLANQLGGRVTLETYPSFYDLYARHIRGWDDMSGGGSVGFARSSRLIPRASFAKEVNRSALVDTILDTATQAQLGVTIHMVGPSARKVQDIESSSSSAVTPAWRHSLWHLVYMAAWDAATATADEVRDEFWGISRAMDPVRRLTPGSGAYLNEADLFEPEPAAAFWGEDNYVRLMYLKEALDPNRILQVHSGVGTDHRGELFKCYPSASKRDENMIEL